MYGGRLDTRPRDCKLTSDALLLVLCLFATTQDTEHSTIRAAFLALAYAEMNVRNHAFPRKRNNRRPQRGSWVKAAISTLEIPVRVTVTAYCLMAASRGVFPPLGVF